MKRLLFGVLFAFASAQQAATAAAPTKDNLKPPTEAEDAAKESTNKANTEPEKKKPSKAFAYADGQDLKWHKLNPEWHMCGSGRQQSPVDVRQDNIVLNTDSSADPLIFNYQFTKATLNSEPSSDGASASNTLVNTGVGLSLNYESGSSVRTTLNGERYDLSTLRFVSPSEHTLQQRHFAAELQLMHTSKAGNTLVVSVFFDLGMENEFLTSLGWTSLPASQGSSAMKTSINVLNAIPFGRHYWTYKGSLTTPPCTEDVAWYLMAEQQQMSVAQLQDLRAALGKTGNNRSTKPLHGRHIYSSNVNLDACFPGAGKPQQKGRTGNSKETSKSGEEKEAEKKKDQKTSHPGDLDAKKDPVNDNSEAKK